MRSLRALAPLLLLCALAAAGCGGTTIRHVTRTVTRSSSTAATTPTVEGETTAATPGATAGGAARHPRRDQASAVARRSPRTILRLAARALRRVGAYSMHADLRQRGTRTIVDLSAVSARRFEASTTIGRSTFELIALSGRVYLRGNGRFWRNQAGRSPAARARARRLTGRWLSLPPSGARSLVRSLGTLAPGTLARCLTEDHGRLTVERRRPVIDHRRAIVVRDSGRAPGSTPSTIAVAADGPPYPLRYVATGRTRRGGRVDVCNDGRGAGATGTINLGRFGATPPIEPPAGAQRAPSVTA